MAKRKFAVFDIDGTLIRWQLYHSVVNELAKQGLLGKDAYKAMLDARMTWKRRSYPEAFKHYEEKIISVYEGALLELAYEHFETAAERTVEEYRDQVYVYTRDLIRDLKAKNYMLFAISGSHKELVAGIAKHYGFDDFIGTEYSFRDGKFTGHKQLGNRDKAGSTRAFVDTYNLTYEGSIAVGDSTSDIPMLEIVEMPIAFNPEQKLMEHAKQNGWKIVVERKNVMYKLESRDGTYVLV